MHCDHDLLASVNTAPKWVIWVAARREAVLGSPPASPLPSYGSDNAGHTTPAKSPEKKLPLSEIMLVNSMVGTPSGEWSTTTASNTWFPVNITPGASLSDRPVRLATAAVPRTPPP